MRRRIVGTLVAGTVLVVPMAAQAQGSTTSSQHHAVAAARAATKKFHSLATAKNQGYSLLRDKNGIACIATPHRGAMGVHFVNGSLVGTPAVRLRQPEALIYAHENGKRRLVAVEYVVLKQAWDAAHGHNAPRPRLYGQPFNRTAAGNRYGLPTFYSLHAWIWKNNPAGMFAMLNRNVHCHN